MPKDPKTYMGDLQMEALGDEIYLTQRNPDNPEDTEFQTIFLKGPQIRWVAAWLLKYAPPDGSSNAGAVPRRNDVGTSPLLGSSSSEGGHE